MKVLVIGGTGNISRCIVSALVERGHDVAMFNRGQHIDAPESGVRVIHGDRLDRSDFESKMRCERFDAVIDMISYNILDALSAFRAFRDRVEVFIHCSSVMTYGPPFSGVNVPESAPLNGTSDYATGKIESDRMLLEAHEKHGFPVIILKPSYTHGPGMTLLRQVRCDGEWIDRLRKRKPILSVGDGLNYFQFLSSRDAAVAFAVAVERPQCIGGVYNLVHPRPHTWDEWHRIAAQALGVDADIVHAPRHTLETIAPKRYGGLSQNFGHTQIFSGSKLAVDIPEFYPSVALVESVSENIAWMDKYSMVPDSDQDDLEDRIIEAIRKLPTHFGRE